MDRFDPAGVQLAWVIDMYVVRFTELYGGYNDWIRQTGHPLNNTFLSDEAIAELWNGGWPRARALFFWAGLKAPEYEAFDKAGRFLGLRPRWSPEAIAIHVRAIQEAYAHPEYW